MNIPRTEADLLQLISDRVEESLFLDYKSGAALTKKQDLTKDITKDVSAFANSAGGIIIYGIAEGNNEEKWLPINLSPVNRQEVSKERLESIVNTIQPRIQGIEIIPIQLSSNDVVYVVVIPQSTTAHQCFDKKYYKRYNFESIPMDDHEVRDVMNRRSWPKIELEAVILFSAKYIKSSAPIMQCSAPG